MNQSPEEITRLLEKKALDIRMQIVNDFGDECFLGQGYSAGTELEFLILNALKEERQKAEGLRIALEGMSELCGNYFDQSGLICERDKFLWSQMLQALANYGGSK